MYHTPVTIPPMSRILILLWNSWSVWATNLNEHIPYFFTKFILISQIMKWKLPDNELLSQMLQIFNCKSEQKVSYLLSRSLGLHDPRSYWTSVLEVRNKCILICVVARGNWGFQNLENIKGNAGFVKEKVRPIEPRLEGLKYWKGNNI